MLTNSQKIYFRDIFREARYKALIDAEDFDSLFHAIETFGAFLSTNLKHNSLSYYKEYIEDFVRESPFYNSLTKEFPAYHSSFSFLYEEVRKFRNGSAHQGVHARNKIRYAIELCLIIESKLNQMDEQVSNYMVRSPLTASDWEPLSHVRKEMLIHSYSYIPIFINDNWQLISDYGLYKYLKAENQESKLRENIQTAVGNGLELIQPARKVAETDSINSINPNSTTPVLVFSNQDEDRLLGIITSFDLI